MISEILEQPLGLQIWVGWLIVVNTASLAFLRRGVEARWVLAAWIANLVSMTALYELNGYNRLLGLSHVLWWTPLLIYLVHRRRLLPRHGLVAFWLQLLMTTNFVSLLIDYVDVVRYVAGDRS